MSRVALALNNLNNLSTLNIFTRLHPEFSSACTRSYVTTAKPIHRRPSVKVLRRQGAQTQEETPSPLSPLSKPFSIRPTRVLETLTKDYPRRPPSAAVDLTKSPTKVKKPRLEYGRNGRFPQANADAAFDSRSPTLYKQPPSQKATAPSSPRKFRERSNAKVVSPPAKPSKGVDGVSTSRTLLIQPAVDRLSRVPVWARPASTHLKKGGTLAPDGSTWSEYMRSLREKHGPWNPTKKISRDAMEGLRLLHKTDPEKFPLQVLAQRFCLSLEAVRRILKSSWTPKLEQREAKLVKERERRAKRIHAMKEAEMHQMVMAGIKLKVHPDDKLQLR